MARVTTLSYPVGAMKRIFQAKNDINVFFSIG